LGSATKQKVEQVVADQERYGAILDSRKAELAQTRAMLESRRAELSKARAQVSLRKAEQQQARAQAASRSAELDAQIKQRRSWMLRNSNSRQTSTANRKRLKSRKRILITHEFAQPTE